MMALTAPQGPPDAGRTTGGRAHPLLTGAAPVLWSPGSERAARARLTAFADFARDRHGAPAGSTDPESYQSLWQWSVDHLEDFWAAVWGFFDVRASATYERVLGDRGMPGAVWFPGAQLNFSENVLRAERHGPALVAATEDGPAAEVSWRDLRGLVGAFQATLVELDVQPGDRVVACLPNGVEAIVAMLACAALGAVWSVCAPDIGVGSALDRFAQLEPVVLISADGVRFAGRDRDRADTTAQLLDGLPSVRAVVVVPVLGHGLPAGLRPGVRLVAWPDAVARPREPRYAQLPADAPLWVVYSSGTTGLPKGLLHSHAGVLLVGLAQSGLQYDLGESDRAFWYTTTNWIMWNTQLFALAVGATAVLYDGSPLHPTPDRLWQLAEEHRVTSLGASPGYLLASERAGLRPGADHDLSALRAVGSTGSPLPASSFRWVYDAVGADLAMHVVSGGTDFAAALVCDAPWLPVTAGEMSCRALGAAAAAWNQDGQEVLDAVGELVLTRPMPSMPLQIWGDTTGARYRDAYFDPPYPSWPSGVWRHGDWVTISSRGTAVVHGRSDSTLNRNGVRLGSADIYAAVEALPEIAEALVLGVELDDGSYWLPLFVHLAPGAQLDSHLQERVRDAVRDHASPRHVPDEIVAVPAVPHTATGKKLEVPLKRIAQGLPLEHALKLDAVDDPDAVRWFAAYLTDRAATRPDGGTSRPDRRR